MCFLRRVAPEFLSGAVLIRRFAPELVHGVLGREVQSVRFLPRLFSSCPSLKQVFGRAPRCLRKKTQQREVDVGPAWNSLTHSSVNNEQLNRVDVGLAWNGVGRGPTQSV